MSSTRDSILQALRDIRLVDPHSHINPHSPASTTLADILGYHYYTELVHSAGMPKANIESPGMPPRELVRRLVPGLKHLTNTAQYAWLIDICHRFFGFTGDELNESNWEAVYESAESTMQLADWADVVLEKSNVQAVFLTNDFDDALEGFDTQKYIPCLRTDDLVFHLAKPEVRGRLEACSGVSLDGSLGSLRDALQQRFEHFVSRGARACAISLPPDFSPSPISDGRASTALNSIMRQGPDADQSHRAAIARRVFWTIVELCDQYGLPMDLMIGVNRGVYPEGVYQGRDLYDSRVSLIQYRELFNAFPQVKFPVSVLASVTNQELVSYAWIFPNVITNGHWWYSNTPSFIRRDAATRLEAVPRNKQIGYYSDAYKLEFIAPKFDMYRRILAGILMDDFVIERGWSEEKAIELGYQILRGNVDEIFPDLSAIFAHDEQPQESYPSHDDAITIRDDESAWAASPSIPAAAIAAGAAAIAGLQDDESESALGDTVEIAEELSVDQMPSELFETIDSSSQPYSFGALNPADEPEPSEAPTDVLETVELVELDDEPETTGGHAEAISGDVEPFEHESYDPHATLELGPGIDAADPSDEIRYFRGDESAESMSPQSGEDASPESVTEPTIGFYADPVTGELTMPVPGAEDGADDELDETYLLPEEPEPDLDAESFAADETVMMDPLIDDSGESEFMFADDQSETTPFTDVAPQPASNDLSFDLHDLELSPMEDEDAELLNLEIEDDALDLAPVDDAADDEPVDLTMEPEGAIDFTFDETDENEPL